MPSWTQSKPRELPSCSPCTAEPALPATARATGCRRRSPPWCTSTPVRRRAPWTPSSTVEKPMPSIEELAEEENLDGLSRNTSRRSAGAAFRAGLGSTRSSRAHQRRTARRAEHRDLHRLPIEQVKAALDEGYALLAGLPELRNVTWIDLPTSHWPMWSRPRELAELHRRRREGARAQRLDLAPGAGEPHFERPRREEYTRRGGATCIPPDANCSVCPASRATAADVRLLIRQHERDAHTASSGAAGPPPRGGGTRSAPPGDRS